MKQYHIVDLFAGVGGLSYGFSQLPGFRILAANEIEKDIAAAYSLNHPGVKMLNCDIADLTKERLAGALGGQQVDIVVGGPPVNPIPRWVSAGWMTGRISFYSISVSCRFCSRRHLSLRM